MMKTKFQAGFFSGNVFVILKTFSDFSDAFLFLLSHSKKHKNIDSYSILEVAYG